ncbi:MAG: DedA family protein [Microgenomates group bacterium]
MLESLINTTTQIIQRFGFWGIFGAGILEQIVVPIPSPIVPMGGGFFLVRKEVFSLEVFKDVIFKVALPFSLGSTLGATMAFLIAYKGAFYLINRFENFFGFNWNDIQTLKKKFFRGKPTDELIIFTLMAIPVVPSVLVSATCGAIRIPLHQFYLYTFLGLAVRGIILGFLGWLFGETYLNAAQGFNKAENIVLLLIGLAILLLLTLGYKRRDHFLGKNRR